MADVEVPSCQSQTDDFDLLERMGRLGVIMDVTHELVVIRPEVSDTGLIGSKGAIVEELRRRARGDNQPDE